MKIGIMGTHGAGKTTFALRQAADLKKNHQGCNVGLMAEVARECPFSINENTTREAQLWIFHRQMTVEIEMAAKNKILVCDRTIIDSLAYAQLAGFSDIVDTYLPIAINWIGTYDKLYYLRPVNGKLANNGFRSVDPVFQRAIDQIFSDWLIAYDITTCQFCFCGGKQFDEIIKTFSGQMERACKKTDAPASGN